MPSCCTYDQVYERIIGLLNGTSLGAKAADLALAQGYTEELEVS